MKTELTAADGHTLSAYAAGLRDARRALVVVQGVGAWMRVSKQYWPRPVRAVRRREWSLASLPGSCG